MELLYLVLDFLLWPKDYGLELLKKAGYPHEVLPNGAVVPSAGLPSFEKMNRGLELLKGAGYAHEVLPNGSVVPVEPTAVAEARAASLAALEAGGDGRATNANNYVAGVNLVNGVNLI